MKMIIMKCKWPLKRIQIPRIPLLTPDLDSTRSGDSDSENGSRIRLKLTPPATPSEKRKK